MDMRRLRDDAEFSDLILGRRTSSIEGMDLESPAYGNIIDPSFTPPLSRKDSTFLEDEGYR
jgi:hypothetical protein